MNTQVNQTLEGVTKALTIVQGLSLVESLTSAIRGAIEAGRNGVTADELAAVFAKKDAELDLLQESIDRAKAEGR